MKRIVCALKLDIIFYLFVDLFSCRGLLTHNDLVKLVKSGVIDALPENINPASIDVRLDGLIRIESTSSDVVVDLADKKCRISTREHEIGKLGYVMPPGAVVLASTVEVFNLPDNIVAEFVLKSSQARNFLNNMLAGYCDPGFHNSKLTLELKNDTQFSFLKIKSGMKIGQMKFYRVKRVPKNKSYRVTGKYNNQAKVTESKGIS